MSASVARIKPQPRTTPAVSEGTASARRLNSPEGSLTAEPLLLHRVDAAQLQTPLRVVHGNTDGIACYSRPGVTCMGDANCHDTHCAGHPSNDVTDDEHDPVALRWFLAGYCGFIAVCLVGIAYADDIYHWLTR